MKIQAISLLRYIAVNCKGPPQEEAYHYMSQIGISPSQRPLSKSERDSVEVPELLASIVKRLFPQVDKPSITEMNTRIEPRASPDIHQFSYIDPTDDENDMSHLTESLKRSSQPKSGKYIDDSTQEDDDSEEP